MSLSTAQKRALTQSLTENLPALVAHAQRVAHLLQAGGPADGLVRSASQLLLAEQLPQVPLRPAALATWAALVPILVEHADSLVQPGAALPPDEILSKEAAAAFLRCSLRTLQRYMDRRKIEFLKRGVGQSAAVEFQRSVLAAFREARKVPTRTRQRPA